MGHTTAWAAPVCLKGARAGSCSATRRISKPVAQEASRPHGWPAGAGHSVPLAWRGSPTAFACLPACLPGLGAAAAWSLPAAPRLCNGDESSAAGWPPAPGGAAFACRCRRGDGTCPNRRRRGSLSAHHFRGHPDWQGRPALIGLPRAGLAGRGPDASRPSARRRRRGQGRAAVGVAPAGHSPDLPRSGFATSRPPPLPLLGSGETPISAGKRCQAVLCTPRARAAPDSTGLWVKE